MKFWPHQEKALFDSSRRKILSWGRRTGMTTCLAHEAVKFAILGKRVLCITPSKGSMDSLFAKIRADGKELQVFKDSISRNLDGKRQYIELKRSKSTGEIFYGSISSFIASSNKTIDDIPPGMDGDVVIVDNASFVDRKFYKWVLLPIMLTRPKSVIIIGATGGPGWISSLWHSGDFSTHWVPSTSRPSEDAVEMWNRVLDGFGASDSMKTEIFGLPAPRCSDST